MSEDVGLRQAKSAQITLGVAFNPQLWINNTSRKSVKIYDCVVKRGRNKWGWISCTKKGWKLFSNRVGGKWLHIFNDSAAAGFLTLVYQTQPYFIKLGCGKQRLGQIFWKLQEWPPQWASLLNKSCYQDDGFLQPRVPWLTAVWGWSGLLLLAALQDFIEEVTELKRSFSIFVFLGLLCGLWRFPG